MIDIGFIKWWMKNFFYPRKFFRAYFWKDVYHYGIRSQIHAWTNGGVHFRHYWSPSTVCSEMYLKITRNYIKNCRGTSVDFFKEDPSSNSGFDDSEQGSIDARLLQRKTFRKVRFAHFFTLFIQDDKFSYYINNEEERRYCFLWARKKYWWANDFITWKWWCQMYTDESIHVGTKMTWVKIPDSENYTLETDTTDRRTGESIDENLDAEYPHLVLSRKYQADFEEGMRLYAKHYYCFGV
jgi:hypothetical protein